MRRFVRSLIQNATVTSAERSVALKLDPVLMRAMEVSAFEEVEIVNAATGARLSAWVEEGASGEVRLPQMRAGDVITIVSHGFLHDGQTLGHKVRVVTVGPKNDVVSIGELS
jgi:aspartate 1-decarboxylase